MFTFVSFLNMLQLYLYKFVADMIICHLLLTQIRMCIMYCMYILGYVPIIIHIYAPAPGPSQEGGPPLHGIVPGLVWPQPRGGGGAPFIVWSLHWSGPSPGGGLPMVWSRTSPPTGGAAWPPDH